MSALAPSGRLAKLGPLVLIAIAWQLASSSGVLPASLLPSFAAVVKQLVGLVTSGEIFPHTFASLARAGTGFFVAVIGGVALGIAMARIRWIERAIEPILLTIYPVPKPALIPLFMVWLGIGDFSKIAVICLACLLPVVVSAHNGAKGVDPMLIWSARARGASEARMLWKVVLPSALPQIAAGVRTAIAIAIIVLVSSEFISAEHGLGYLIFSYGGAGAEDAMLAVVIWLAAIGYALDQLYLAALKRTMRWHAFAQH